MAKLWNALIARVRALFVRDSRDDLDDELRFHIEMESQALERGGLARDAALGEARRRFGGVDRYREELRDVRGLRWLEWLAQDARYAARVALRFPTFTVIVVLTLGVAIGANTAVFSVIDTVLLRPLPFPNPHELVLLYSQNPDKSQQRFSVSYADFLDWRRQTSTFAGMSAFTSTSMTLTEGDEPERLSGLAVTPDFFDVLGIRPRLGRVFHGGDTEAETGAEIVLTHGLWTRRFGADSSIVGRTVKLGAGARTVIGVLPPEFDLVARTIDAVTVLNPASIPDAMNHAQHMASVIGRMRPGVELTTARQDLAGVAARLAVAHPSITGWTTNVFSYRDELVRAVRNPLLILFAAAGLVLLIACINVANLLLTRNAVRNHEVALRQALGASRGRLFGQLIVESAALAIAGVAAGMAIALGILRIIARVAPAGLLPQAAGIPMNWRMLAFALVLTVVTTLVAGLWPALRATATALARSLRESGRGASEGVRALHARRLLVVAEVSLALVLLICAGLVLQSLEKLMSVDPGFRVDHIVTARVSLPGRYNDSTQLQFYRDLQTRLLERGGIEAMGAANTQPISSGGIITNIRLIGRPSPTGEPLMVAATAITPGYFRALDMPLLGGADVSWTRNDIVVSEGAARYFWPGESPIGKRIGLGRDSVGLEVVGIVRDAHNRGLAVDPPPMIYLSYKSAASIARSMTLVVRGAGDQAALVATTKRVLRELDPVLPLYNVQTVREIVDQSVAQPRLNTTLMTLFAGVAVVLAVIGIYGVVSYSVTQRAHEIGVRVALGAQRGDILRLVLREGATLAAVGAILGVAGALAGTMLIRSWLFGIERTDPMTIAATALGLVLVAMLASYLPARRAAHVNPVMAIRGD